MLDKDWDKPVLIKTFKSHSVGEIDNMINDFRKSFKVIAIQTHSFFDVENVMWFVYVVFYRE